ncbi:MAG TPA: DUF1697 domain-containing protein [Gemmatimonadaceae bacterium]|nr:DUF1697 domain-containing protein [Gemmatimonadaceae bacterium]
MPRYVAFLRGVMPTNCKMPALKRAFEAAAFADVATVLGSGNVVFSARTASESALEKRAEAAMTKALGRTFYTIVRPVDAVRALLEADPFAAFTLAPNAKRVVTFARGAPRGTIALPVELDGARILAVRDREVLTAYVPGVARTPVFMSLIAKHFGPDVTTRTWDTVKRCALAGARNQGAP